MLSNCVRIAGADDRTIGSGVLLNGRTVLTALHVATGARERIEWTPAAGPARTVCGEWKASLSESDLGILHLCTALPVAPLRVAKENEFATFSEPLFVGFSSHAGPPKKPRQVKLDLVTRSCTETEKEQFSCRLERSFVAKVNHRGDALCLGDSGGPMFGQSSGQTVLTGILSERARSFFITLFRGARRRLHFFEANESCEQTVVFSRVDIVRTWIDEHIAVPGPDERNRPPVVLGFSLGIVKGV